MSTEHHWLSISAHGEDAPGKSLDTYEQCARCGALKHDYRHGGGYVSPNYPTVHKYGVSIDPKAPCAGVVAIIGETQGKDPKEHGGDDDCG